MQGGFVMAQQAYGTDYGAFRPLISRVAWGALFAGVIVGFITHVLLTMLGLAIGFNVFDPAQSQVQTLGLGSGIWLVLTSMIATFTGAWVATSLANISFRLDGVLHGILTWGLMLILGLFLLSGGLRMVFGGLGQLTSAVISSGQVTMPEGGIAAVREHVEEGLTPEAIQRTEEAQAQIREMEAQEVSSAAAGVAWMAFITAMLSLIAGAIGGMVGLRSHRAL